MEEVVHEAEPSFWRSAGSERHEQVAPSAFVQAVEVDRAVTLVTQQFEQGWTPFFLGRLQLAVGHPQQLHLQGFDEKILGISAVGTRERQM
ncbi:MAG: hypothetical protein ABI051_09655 [Vicinamibacterales bacterium]